jgi:hypothetical protein
MKKMENNEVKKPQRLDLNLSKFEGWTLGTDIPENTTWCIAF